MQGTNNFSDQPLALDNDENLSSKNCNIFLVVKYIWVKQITNKFIIFWSFLSSDITPTSSKGKLRFIVYGSVTRYGPQSAASASDRMKTFTIVPPTCTIQIYNLMRQQYIHLYLSLYDARTVLEQAYIRVPSNEQTRSRNKFSL